MQSSQPAVEETTVADGNGQARIRVLHVDDDPGLLDLVATFIEREDERFEVETTTDAADCVDRLGAESFDCVVSDYDMPGMNGLEFLEAVRERHPDLPFVLFTGKGSEEIASEAISAGVTEYLQKETGTEQYSVLANRIEQAVSRRRAEEELAETKRQQDVLLSNLPGMAYQCSQEPGWPMTFVSDGVRDLVGYDPEALTNGDVNWEQEIIVPEDRDHTRAAVENTPPGESFEVTYRVETADGERRWVWEQGQVIENGQTSSLEGLIIDVTDRKRQEETLAELRTKYQTLVEETTKLVFVIDHETDAVVGTSDAADALDVNWAGTPVSVLFEDGLDAFERDGETTLELATTEGRLVGTVATIEGSGRDRQSVFVGEFEAGDR